MSALPGARVSNTVNTPPCLSSTLSTVKALFSGSLPTKWWQRWSPAEPGSHLHNLATVAEIWLFFLNISNQSPNSLPYWSGSGHIPISKLITLTRIGTGPLARTSIHPSIYLPIHPSLDGDRRQPYPEQGYVGRGMFYLSKKEVLRRQKLQSPLWQHKLPARAFVLLKKAILRPCWLEALYAIKVLCNLSKIALRGCIWKIHRRSMLRLSTNIYDSLN